MNTYKIFGLFLVLINIAYAEEYDVDSFRYDEDYFVVSADINNDGIYELAVSHQLNGNIFFLQRINGKRELVLNSTNFSVDGGEKFIKIIPTQIPVSEQKDPQNPLVMTIVNSLPPTEFRHNIRYISANNNWLLASSEYISTYVNKDGSMNIIRCEYEYDNIVLDENLAKNFPYNTVVINSHKLFSNEILKNDNHCNIKTISD